MSTELQRLLDELAVLAARVADDLAAGTHRERVAAEQPVTELVKDLLFGRDDTRARAALALVESETVRPFTDVVAVVCVPDPAPGAGAAMAAALQATCRWYGSRACLHLADDVHGVLLVGGRRPAGECAVRLDAGLSATLRGRAVIGIGQARAELAEAGGSYDEAMRACRVAGALPGAGRIVHWADLGIYRALSRMDGDQGTHPGLEELFGDESKLPLLRTLEVFLDLAGNVHATAERLHVHRATLYYRLDRIAELASTDLKDGGERLSLHLALKLGRLAGRYRPEPQPPRYASTTRLSDRSRAAGASRTCTPFSIT